MSLEENLKRHKFIILKLKLKEHFNHTQWTLITAVDPKTFLNNQQHLLNKLMNNPKMHHKYFQLFYSNHIQILHWYILAAQNKRDIQPYVFKQFLAKKVNFYQQKTTTKNSQKVSQNQSQQESENISFMRPSPNKIKQMQEGVMNKFFQDLIQINEKEHQRKPINLKIFKRQKETVCLDAHEFYLRTFDACNGRKYVSYDYEKHMKGMSQRYKYNQFLRSKQNPLHLSCKMQNSCQNLTNFVQFQDLKQANSRQKCSLLPMSQILNKITLNSTKGLKKVTDQNKSSKLVFVNHQGKPITYYLSKIGKKPIKTSR